MSRVPPLLHTLLSLTVLSLSAFAQDPKPAKPAPTPFTNPWHNPVDNPDLPRILLIGDSISIAYTPLVRKQLDGVANVHRPKTNCRWSAVGAESIREWIGDGTDAIDNDWDLIHFNFGLWDWYGWKQDPKATPASYAKNLDRIVTTLKENTLATLVFANTTPPCREGEQKVNLIITDERAAEFNNAARAVMEKHNVGINNLYDAVRKKRDTLQRAPDDVHYTDKGNRILANKVAARIKRDLTKK